MRIALPPFDAVPLGEIDLFDPARFQAVSQHATWWTLRHEAPVWWQERGEATGFWSITRHPDATAVLKDHRTFSSEHGTILDSVGVGDSAGGRTITLMDPPRHIQVRRPTARCMNPQVARSSRGRMRAAIVERFASCFAGGEVDFALLARPLPMVAAGDMMGIPSQLWTDIAAWAGASIAPEDDVWGRGSDEVALREVHYELFSRLSELIGERRRRPGNDLISTLIRLELDGRRLSDEQVLMNCYSFIMGANSTTAHVASHTLLALIERPECWRMLAHHPGLIPTAIEEGARWTSPTNHLIRRARTDAEIAGVRIRSGDWVCVWVGSANRDEAVFDRPYEFVPERSPNPHLSFGAAAHYCIGAHASRAALGMLFQELLARVDHFELAGEPTHLRSNWINGLTSLPVVAHPRTA